MRRKTQFSDVCGAMDELKRLAVEEPGRLHDHAEDKARPLLEDALYMIGRMRTRIQEYEAFRERLRALLGDLDRMDSVDEGGAERGASDVLRWLERGTPMTHADVAELHEAAERVRSVASEQEHVLRHYKDLVLQVYEALEEVRGNRPWLLEDDEKAPLVQRLKKRYQAWIPPEPAGSVMLDWLCRDRLTVEESRAGDGEPDVLFEDGGSIPMSQLRWNETLRNFVPAGSSPGGSGLSYRGRGSNHHQRPESE